MGTTTLNVYPDRDRPCEITVYSDGAALDLSAVTRMTVEFVESTIVADTDVDPTLIDWSTGDGIVIFNFGALGLPIGRYIATLFEYDIDHPNGQPIIAPADDNLVIFNVVGDAAIVLTVEDGSNVVGANTYASVADARAYAKQRGKVLPIDDDEVAVMLIQGMDYLESRGCKYQGYPTYDDQALSWPRKCVVINCQAVPEDAIPKQLTGALIQLVLAMNVGIDIFPNISAQDYVTEETIGPITTKYANPINIGLGDMSPQMTAVNALITPLMYTCAKTPFTLTTKRV